MTKLLYFLLLVFALCAIQTSAGPQKNQGSQSLQPQETQTSDAALPNGKAAPRNGKARKAIQSPNIRADNMVVMQRRRDAVRNAFRHAYNGYRKYAFGHDELKPVSNKPADPRNGFGATIVDSLDTMYIMGLEEEFKEAREFVAKLDWNKYTDPMVQVFETTIRYLGGLLSAYDMSGDRVFLDKAVELADKLMPSFNSPTGIPYQYVNFKSGAPARSGETGGASVLAEIGTLQLEFGHLAQLTGNRTYFTKVQKVVDVLDKAKTTYPGLYPIYINPETAEFETSFVTFGGGGDSFYEYLIKLFIYYGGEKPQYLRMYDESITHFAKYMVSGTANFSRLIQMNDLDGKNPIFHQGELACFLPGNLILAARITDNPFYEQLAYPLMNSCYNAWIKTPTGIAPESWWYVNSAGKRSRDFGTPENKKRSEKWGFWPDSEGYILRPETIESLFYFYRLTGNPKYQDMGWQIFNSIEKYCKTSSAYSGLKDVTDPSKGMDDTQESFFFAETLKYLYLLFSPPNVVSLDEWIFNTEAHPFRPK
ncbi:uncharacterized protein VTP21DRAFT_7251 [Calcarisporiella thermophila]|uniref:uncharacterized protein n=1 Tax=Calcarisporiella thermophila TaxID=911321 RepID=UPI003742DE59